MHRTCCRAANAYSPAIALRTALSAAAGLLKPATTSSRAELRTPRGAGLPGTFRRVTVYSKHVCNRGYGTRVGRTTEQTPEWTEIEEKEEQSERLGLYESVLGPESPQPRRERPLTKRKDDGAHFRAGRDARSAIRKHVSRDTHDQNVPGKDADRLHWRKHMLALSQRAQDLRRNKMDLKTAKAMLDYEATVIYPQEPDTQTKTRLPWALKGEERESLSSMEVLDEEIRRFANFMTLNEAENAARGCVIGGIYNLIRKVMGDHITPYVYGSQKYGTSLPFSDIDIGLYDNTRSVRKPAMLNDSMEAFYHHLNEESDYICVVFRGGAFPIITAQHKASGIDVQIVVGTASTTQSANVARYLSAIPNMPALYAVIRTTFGMRGFVDPFIGGISAYGTFMLLAASLTRRGLPFTTHDSPGTQLLHFLAFYEHFDTTKYGLTLQAKHSPTASAPFKKYRAQDLGTMHINLKRAADIRGAPIRGAQYDIARIKPLQPYLLCLQDPAQVHNDLGKRCNAIKHILKTIAHLRGTVTNRMTNGSHRNRKDYSASMLAPFVGDCHDVYAERRRKAEEFGLQEIEARKLRKPWRKSWKKGHEEDSRGLGSAEVLTPAQEASREGVDAQKLDAWEQDAEGPDRGQGELSQRRDDGQRRADGDNSMMGM